MQLVNVFCAELFGDRIQLAGLLNCYFRAMLSFRTSQHNQLKSSSSFTSASIKSHSIKPLLNKIESTFSSAIKNCYNSFCPISEPIVKASAIDKLIDEYKMTLPSHYETMRSILGFDKKVNLVKNLHLVENGYYDCLIFYQFLSQC